MKIIIPKDTLLPSSDNKIFINLFNLKMMILKKLILKFMKVKMILFGVIIYSEILKLKD